MTFPFITSCLGSKSLSDLFLDFCGTENLALLYSLSDSDRNFLSCYFCASSVCQFCHFACSPPSLFLLHGAPAKPPWSPCVFGDTRSAAWQWYIFHCKSRPEVWEADKSHQGVTLWKDLRFLPEGMLLRVCTALIRGMVQTRSRVDVKRAHTHTHCQLLEFNGNTEFLVFYCTGELCGCERRRQSKVNTRVRNDGGCWRCVCVCAAFIRKPDSFSTQHASGKHPCFASIISLPADTSHHFLWPKIGRGSAPVSATHYQGTFRWSTERKSIFNCAELILTPCHFALLLSSVCLMR